MTLVVCIIAKDSIVLASDSKVSAILTSNDTVKKIFKVDDHNALGIAGDGSLALHFFDLISKNLELGKGITDLAEQLRKLGKEKFDDFFSHQEPKDRPSITLLLAGYSLKNKPAIYQLNSKDNFVPRKSPTGFDCIGIPIIAEYILNRIYDPEIKENNAVELAAFCIKETKSQDHRVGGPIQIATFSNTKNYSEFSQEEIEKIENKCEKHRLLQRHIFYPED